MDTWIFGAIGLIVGLTAGYFIGNKQRKRRSFVANVQYSCQDRIVSGDIQGDPPYPLRIYAYAWQAGSAPNLDYPPDDAQFETWPPKTTDHFEFQDDGWPNLGAVDFAIWTVYDFVFDGIFHAQCGTSTTTTMISTTTTSPPSTTTSPPSTTTTTASPTTTTSAP